MAEGTAVVARAKKELVALAAACLVAIGGAGAGATGLLTSSENAERVRALEVRLEVSHEGMEKRLDRIETKLDRALDGRR